MTEVANVPDKVLYSNVSVVRQQDGRLEVYVGQEKMLGAVGINLQPTSDGVGVWTFAVSSSRIKMCEGQPAQPVYEDNVVPFRRSEVTEEMLPKTSA